MKNRYELPRDIEARFHGTIIRHGGHPYFCLINGLEFRLCKLETARTSAEIVKRAMYDDPLLDISTVPLGYTNYRGEAYYIERGPIRRYKQGIDDQAVRVSMCGRLRGGGIGVRTKDLMFSKEFEASILGKYPTAERCIETLRKKAEDGVDYSGSMAFGRHNAMTVDAMGIIKVYHRNEYVGWIAPGSRVINVPSHDCSWIVSKELSGFGVEIN